MSKCPVSGYSPNSGKCSCQHCLDERARWQREYRRKNPRHVRAMNLRKYGISPEDYDYLYEDQQGVCAVCGQEQSGHNQFGQNSLCVDHDHKTGKVRGLLGNPCNRALGFLRDNTKTIARLLNYRSSYD